MLYSYSGVGSCSLKSGGLDNQGLVLTITYIQGCREASCSTDRTRCWRCFSHGEATSCDLDPPVWLAYMPVIAMSRDYRGSLSMEDIGLL